MLPDVRTNEVLLYIVISLIQWCQTFFVYGPISYFSVLMRATGLNDLDSIIFLACTIRILLIILIIIIFNLT